MCVRCMDGAFSPENLMKMLSDLRNMILITLDER